MSSRAAAATIGALASLLRREALPLNPINGVEGPPLVAQIDEAVCIGCAKCLPPCPVDAIIGSRKQMHTVVMELCTGCELCIAPCPVDCIKMVPRAGLVEHAQPAPEPRDNRERFYAHQQRGLARQANEQAAVLAARASRPLGQATSLGMTDMHLATRKALYRRLQAANPEPTTELLYNTPFELLVAVMLSAHTTDKSVNGATRKLFPIANTPEALLKLGEDGVKPYLKTVGLYNAKTKNLIGLVPGSSSRNMAAKCRQTAKPSRRYQAWAARPPAWCSIWSSATSRSLSTRIFSASPTAPVWHPERRLAPSRMR